MVTLNVPGEPALKNTLFVSGPVDPGPRVARVGMAVRVRVLAVGGHGCVQYAYAAEYQWNKVLLNRSGKAAHERRAPFAGPKSPTTE